MATKFKKIDKPKEEITETHESLLDTMKPFIKFGIGAAGLIGSTLIHIVKSIPKPGHSEQPKTKPGSRIIKIK